MAKHHLGTPTWPQIQGENLKNTEMFIVRNAKPQNIKHLTTMEMDPQRLQRTHAIVKNKSAQRLHKLGSVRCHTLRSRTPKGSEASQPEIQPRDLTLSDTDPQASQGIHSLRQRNTNISVTSHPVAMTPKHLRTSDCGSATSKYFRGLIPWTYRPKYSKSSRTEKQSPKQFMDPAP